MRRDWWWLGGLLWIGPLFVDACSSAPVDESIRDDAAANAPETVPDAGMQPVDSSVVQDATPSVDARAGCLFSDPIERIEPAPGLEAATFHTVPWVAFDELQVVYWKHGSDNSVAETFRHTRASTSEPFGPAEPLPMPGPRGSSPGWSQARHLALSVDGQRVYFHLNELAGDPLTVRGTGLRSALAARDDAGTLVYSELSRIQPGAHPWPTPTGLLFFSHDGGLASMPADALERDASVELTHYEVSCGQRSCLQPRTNYAVDELYFHDDTDGPFLSRQLDGIWQPPIRIAVPEIALRAVVGVSRDGCRVYLTRFAATGELSKNSLWLATRRPR